MRKTVFIVSSQWSRIGGLEIVTQDIGRAFVELGWNVTVFAADDLGQSETLPNGIRIIRFSPRQRFLRSLWFRFFRYPILAWAIKRSVRPGDIVIIGHLYLVPILGWVPKSLGIQRWVWVHGIEAWGEAAKKWIHWLNGVDRVVAVSDYTAKQVSMAGVAVPVSTVHNSVDTLRFVPTRTPALIRRDEVLICGRLSAAEKYKGHEVLFEALPIAEQQLGKPVFLRIIGAGDDEQRLRVRAKELGIADRVRFCGRVTDAELLDAYQHCGVFAMPSKVEFRPETKSWTGEGFGLVYAEVEACGRPVVVSSDGGASETAVDGVTGLIVSPTDVQANAEALSRILSSPDWADDLGRHGREFAVNHFSFERFKERISGLIRDNLDDALTIK